MTATPPAKPAAPTRAPVPSGNPRLVKLLDNVKDALLALPGYYESGTCIEGLEAGDLFNLNSVLGSSIEVQVVDTLNKIRRVWDPDDEWPEHRFERSSQAFPDVRLVARTGGVAAPVLGIELKGWYLFAREAEPSFRYTASVRVCSPFDLLVVVPWHLKNVLAGVPVVYEPYIEHALFVAEYRNYWWEHVRVAKGDSGINPPPGSVAPYPPPKSKHNDQARSDPGNNFGRVARLGLMNDYVGELLGKRVAGVEARHWVMFFRTYAEAADPDEITRKLAAVLAKASNAEATEMAEHIVAVLSELGEVFKSPLPDG